MAQFTTLNLTGERVLVKGTDSAGVTSQEVLDASEWNEIKAHQGYAQATEDFDTQVLDFFKPLTDAADKLDAAKAPAPVDPITYVVLHEGVDHVEGESDTVVSLSPHSVVLRLIEQGNFDRLVWVNNVLEVLAASTKSKKARNKKAS